MRLNRVVLTGLGLIVVAGATIWLLAALDVLALDQPGDIYARAADAHTRSEAVWNTVVILVLVGLTTAAVLWTLAQLRPPQRDRSIGTVTLERSRRGTTTFDVNALRRVTSMDFERLTGVVRARTRVVEGGRNPVVRVDVTTDRRADLHEIRREVDLIIDRIRHALDAEGVRYDITYRPRMPTNARVV